MFVPAVLYIVERKLNFAPIVVVVCVGLDFVYILRIRCFYDRVVELAKSSGVAVNCDHR